MNERIEAIVHGRVQMVMYRDFTNRKARALGLVGEVENLPDGTVRVVAEGKPKDIERFLTRLRSGPMLARVERVDVVKVPATGSHTSFDIVL